MTLHKVLALVFSTKNRLTSYGTILTAGYRGDGLRAWKESNGVRTYFLYDGSLPIFETDLTDNGERVNTFGAAGLVSRHEPSCLGCSGTSFYTFDSQGNVSQSLYFRAQPASSQAFEAHGVAIQGGGGPWGFGAQWGYYTDSETGLQLLTHRYYDPQLGRFLTRDPIGYRGGINLYAYVNNNVVNAFDPLGLQDALEPSTRPNDNTNWPQLFLEFLSGTGAKEHQFDSNSDMTKGLRTSPDVDWHRRQWCSLGKPLYENQGHGQFGAPWSNAKDGPWEAGFNGPRQFVGSFSMTIRAMPNDQALFIAYNKTSLPSLLYHIPFVPALTYGGPFSNTEQTFMWSEECVCSSVAAGR